MFKNILSLLIFIFSYQILSQSIDLKNEYKLTNQYFKNKNYTKALSTNDKALKLSKKEFGYDHLTTATLLENKGRLLLELESINKAEYYFREVVKIRKKLINKNDPDTADALNYLALTLRKQNRLEDAIQVHNEVLTMMGNIIATNPGQISELSRRSALYRARAYQTKGQELLYKNKIEEAKGNFRIAIKIFERTLGKNKKELNYLNDMMKNINKQQE